MALWHVVFSSPRRLPLFPTEEQQRKAVRCLARIARGVLVLFGLVNEHGHTVVQSPKTRVGPFKRLVRLSLGAVAAEPIGPVWVEPVEDPKHLRSLVRYNLTQAPHHEVPSHPALWSGSCFHELARTRAVDGLELRIAETLPKLRLREVYEMVGLPPQELEPVTDDELRGLGAARLVEAAAAALALGPGLSGNKPAVVQARQTVIHLGRQAGIRCSELSWALDMTARSVCRLTHTSRDRKIELAVRMRLALEDAVVNLQRRGSPDM
jgi:hypothetical protein